LLSSGMSAAAVRDRLIQLDQGRNERQLIVIGNEGNGIQNKVLNSGYPTVRIPGSSNAVESLNAAIACSIGLFELSGNSGDRS